MAKGDKGTTSTASSSRLLPRRSKQARRYLPFAIVFVSCSVAKESLERLLRDAQMNGIRQIPREPAAKPEATPPPPKEEGKEEYPYKCVVFFFWAACVCVGV